MIISFIQALFFFIKIEVNMSEQEKKRKRIYDLFNAETKPKNNSEITGVSLRLPSDLNPLDYVIWGVLENKTNATSHRLRLLLIKNGRKCLKSLF